MVQWEIYSLCQNKRGYDHDVSDTGTYMKFMKCVLNVCCMISKEWKWVSYVYDHVERVQVCTKNSWVMSSMYIGLLVRM